MRNRFENIAVALVILLSLGIVYLIVQYNSIDDDALEDVAYTVSELNGVSKQENTTKYLQNMEKYSDVDVKVDPTKDDTINRVVVKSEDNDNRMEKALEDNYVKNLEAYSDEMKESKNSIKNTKELENMSEPAMPKKEIVDEVGMALDDVINAE